ncbi:monovalent cation/H+ antiporter complex subunit F [Olivibacter sitiensis]|uniref:monovalent cation/H+ antiporter complex subunit F n=1 Tax=Olivibacter sitiensis TaxID=376470 RepID=UPI000409F5ED|nr:monovalent cation/H+ antiporter complex subunit F [Olivibacter sitiensis]
MTFFTIILTICIVLIGLSTVLALIRFFIGPTLADRLSALDLIAAYLIAMMVVYILFTDKLIFFDVALVFSLVAFWGALSFAYYLINRISK